MAATGLCITMPRGMPKEHRELSTPNFFSQVDMLLEKAAALEAVARAVRKVFMFLPSSTPGRTLCRMDTDSRKAAAVRTMAPRKMSSSCQMLLRTARSPDQIRLTMTRKITKGTRRLMSSMRNCTR